MKKNIFPIIALVGLAMTTSALYAAVKCKDPYPCPADGCAAAKTACYQACKKVKNPPAGPCLSNCDIELQCCKAAVKDGKCPASITMKHRY